ncbi:MAG: type II toxin-antitoxin system RelE/ParE family toxin [Saprospiraceae bacterium]|nr:type II toxin-antitoxin system RelE/ParE family toxin [Saprospiraceae bacterium]
MKQKFEILFLEDAKDFLSKQDTKTLQKILQNIEKAQILHDPRLLKKLQGEIWEFRTQYNGKHHRLLAFWDKKDKKSALIIATHGFVKKQGAVPKKEIEKAEKIRTQYFE